MSSHMEHALIVACILGFAVMEFVTRCYQANVRGRATANDAWLEVLMFISLVAVTQPIALLGSNALCKWLIPAQHNAWADLPWWGMTGLLLIGDDLTQYLWHRASHTRLLWPLHRAHHSASYMSVRITYRNNFFYYLMMPGLWIGGVAVYLGFGPVYAAYLVVKLAVIVGAHCAWPWDAPLYRIRALRPLMWVIERTISTPATHWAHHALTNADGIGHYKGNFGNLLFFWDVLFGTAHITRKYPAKIGLQDDVLFGAEPWTAQMFYPLVQSKREHSALRPGGAAVTEMEMARDQAASVKQEAA
ncbi:sterol desaturase family protein [Ralstonia sp.]|uniref:sterol desaturase family protein n=1 Tax=Ralstonia sp. TaxID=54061 RepID=UPI002B63C37E|nr:sterol desaturase family protein [Ralstonia sp.]HWV03942.1 sterol desaturase family protein [Ralstonia sp.]